MFWVAWANLFARVGAHIDAISRSLPMVAIASLSSHDVRGSGSCIQQSRRPVSPEPRAFACAVVLGPV